MMQALLLRLHRWTAWLKAKRQRWALPIAEVEIAIGKAEPPGVVTLEIDGIVRGATVLICLEPAQARAIAWELMAAAKQLAAKPGR